MKCLIILYRIQPKPYSVDKHRSSIRRKRRYPSLQWFHHGSHQSGGTHGWETISSQTVAYLWTWLLHSSCSCSFRFVSTLFLFLVIVVCRVSVYSLFLQRFIVCLQYVLFILLKYVLQMMAVETCGYRTVILLKYSWIWQTDTQV